MNGILFVNDFTPDKNTAKEIYKYWYFQRPFALASYAVIGIDLFVLLWLTANGWYFDVSFIYFFILLAAYLPVKYLIMVNNMTKKHKEISHGKPLRFVFSVSADKIYPSDDEDYYIGLNNIKYAYETKNYIVCVTAKTRSLMIMKKDSFTTGDINGFRRFLIENGKKIKGHKNKG